MGDERDVETVLRSAAIDPDATVLRLSARNIELKKKSPASSAIPKEPAS
jgi:hypothetical protein